MGKEVKTPYWAMGKHDHHIGTLYGLKVASIDAIFVKIA